MKIIVVVIAVLWSVFPAWPATKQFTVTTTEIAEALNKAGVEVSPDHVSLLSEVLSTNPEPLLRVRSFEKSINQQLVARMECQNNQECVPFLVGVKQGPEQTSVLTSAANVRPAIATYPAMSTFVLRTGVTATLQLDGEHIHITIPVICMENGAVGQTIRVTDRNRRVVYRAEVVNGGLLKGRVR